MFLSTHTTFALALTRLLLPWWLIFVLSFTSHFLLDFIPHGDENVLGKKLNKKQTIKRMLSVVFIDFVIILLLLILFSLKHKISGFVILAAFLAILPDGLEFLNIITNNKYKYLNYFSQFHHYIHNWPKINIPLIWGIIMQISIVVALVLIFF